MLRRGVEVEVNLKRDRESIFRSAQFDYDDDDFLLIFFSVERTADVFSRTTPRRRETSFTCSTIQRRGWKWRSWNECAACLFSATVMVRICSARFQSTARKNVEGTPCTLIPPRIAFLSFTPGLNLIVTPSITSPHLFFPSSSSFSNNRPNIFMDEILKPFPPPFPSFVYRIKNWDFFEYIY